MTAEEHEAMDALQEYYALHAEIFPDQLDATHVQRLDSLRALARAYNAQLQYIGELRALLRRELSK